MSMTDELDELARQIDRAADDAKSYGAGWLMVDQRGLVKRISPPDVAHWGADQVNRIRPQK